MTVNAPRLSLRPAQSLALVVLLQLLTACTGDAQEFRALDPSAIDGGDVERIIRTLAADDMEGRASFTPAADRTADFIAGEFATAGLTMVEGAEGYLQRFPVYSVVPQEVAVELNGATVDEGDVLVRTGARGFSWTTGEADVVVVGPDADPREAIFPYLQGADGNTLLLVDPAHQAILNQLERFMAQPMRSFSLEDASSLVIVRAAASAEVEYSISVSSQVTEASLTNVVGTIPGRRTDEIVLFAGHHDHVGVRSGMEGDSIFNGANDNASGTTAVISLAKYYAQRGTPERTLMFVAFAAEEMGGYGSRYFSQQLDPDHIVAMFNIEMIGKPAVEGPNTAWITGFERSSFGPLLQEAVEGTGYDFYPDPYPDQNLFYRSDNATLARLGVPAHSISTTPIDVDPDYHQASDHVETLDLDHLTNTIRAIALGAETMVTGVATPTRVDPATVR